MEKFRNTAVTNLNVTNLEEVKPDNQPMENYKNWSRRKFSKAVVSAQLLLASGALTIPLACKSKEQGSEAEFNPAQKETLELAMDEIIPANEKMPSASQIGSLEYVKGIIEELPELSPLFHGLIEEIESQSQLISGTGFATLNRKERINVLQSIEKSSPELFKTLKDFTYESYYTNEKIYSLINYDPHPTGTAGPEMDPFDDTLLDRVKTLPPIYIKI